MGDSHSLFEIGTQHLPNLCRNPFWDESNAAYYWYYPLSNWCSVCVSICCFPCLWTGAPFKKRSGDSPFHFGIAIYRLDPPPLPRDFASWDRPWAVHWKACFLNGTTSESGKFTKFLSKSREKCHRAMIHCTFFTYLDDVLVTEVKTYHALSLYHTGPFGVESNMSFKWALLVVSCISKLASSDPSSALLLHTCS